MSEQCNQITLHRKGGRPEWVFEKNGILNGRVYEHTTRAGILYRVVITRHTNRAYVQRFYGEELNGKPWWRDVKTSKIHASHFVLGNVTITF